ncbi:MAG: PD-(D/E)XK nuclease family protein [Candidatus Brocadiae bacterium]|nr:PD-(D/E)XK nuclease family protein [Candidatus Brocadiia bacterium]
MKQRTRQEVHISHSQVSEFLQCPRRYHLHRRLGLRPEFVPSGLLFGSAIHEALAFYHQMRLEGKKTTLEALCDAFSSRYEAEQLPVKLRPGESKTRLISLAKRMLEAYLLHGEFSGEVIAIEEGFRLELSDRLPPVIGRIDLVEKKPCDGLVVTDFKTARSRREPDPDQLLLYREAVRLLDYPHNGKVKARYILLLKSERPDIVVYEPEPGPGAIDKLRSRYEQVWGAVQSGCSFPHPGWWCRGCQWQRHCDQS